MKTSQATAQALSTDLTIYQAIEAFRNGTLTSASLVEACLQRIEELKHLNVFVTVDAAGARKAAAQADMDRAAGKPLKPLAGIPIVVKDNIHAAGLPCTAGSPALADFVPEKDAPTLQKLRDAGAVVLGKTNMNEFAFGATGYNPSFNTGRKVGVRNAYDSERIAGGSSSGSAAAIGARMSLAALGTDTGGSMRIPCALNGCASLRPSSGRYPSLGTIPISTSRDTVGPMAQCMSDVALLDALITDDYAMPPIALAELRLGVPAEFWANLDEDTQACAEAALTWLREHGVTLVDIPDAGLFDLNQPIGFPVVIHEARVGMQAYLREQGPGISIEAMVEKINSPDVKAIYEQWVLPGKLPTPQGMVDVEPLFEAAEKTGRNALKQRYQTLFESLSIDALVFPTTTIVAPLAGPEVNEPETFERLIRNTEPAASAGLACIQLPVGLGGRSGLPVGLELDAPARSDRRLLAIGIAIESVLGRIPPA
ncbi:MAG TPA: indoleacetamide hydrolase [Noviherbaspirillum sp.]|uniref:indoleacetamide hydrolase n=1 Tax=Noviherbaspirillum sp. TaxID=1926288 RepID=UPI002B479EBE|nr:indoleacetamide hydrolase [Noviherbaspirillum sp.]HJV86874.1 indoleacetamide hydrolase [Noviherbaspirillum sp.]